jgi:hypothetical protein
VLRSTTAAVRPEPSSADPRHDASKPAGAGLPEDPADSRFSSRALRVSLFLRCCACDGWRQGEARAVAAVWKLDEVVDDAESLPWMAGQARKDAAYAVGYEHPLAFDARTAETHALAQSGMQ